MVSVSRWFGVLAILALVAFPVGVASPPILEDTGLFEPKPAHTLTLPGPVSAGTYIYYDDFSWCEAPPCEVISGPHVSSRMNGATGSTTVIEEAWEIEQGGLEGTPALTYTDPGWVMGTPELTLQIRPDSPFGNLGSNIEVSVVATASTSLMVEEGGLRVQMTVWDDGMQQLAGPYECLVVPGQPVGDGFYELLPLNPLCKTVPMTTKIELKFTVEEGLSGEVPDVAIDSILVERV